MASGISGFFKKNIVAVSLNCSVLVVLWASSNINWGGDNWIDILEADAKGYYAYLPATFIYHDQNFDFYEEIDTRKYYYKHLTYDYRKHINGKNVNKYFCGTALAEFPFFVMGHVATLCSDYPPDGYSRLYLIFIQVGAIFYLWLSFYFIARILRLYHIRETVIAFTIPVFIFGTNIFLYTALDPGMSHIYSFCFFSMFIYYAMKYFRQPAGKILPVLGVLLGIIILIRPSNGLLLLCLPFLAGSWDNLKKGLTGMIKHPMALLLSVLLCAGIIFIQLVSYKIATGSFLIYAYTEEKFHFFKPHIINILFSYKKGLFLYTPILLLSLAGYRYLARISVFKTIAHFIFLFIVTYILSTWWMWWYGGGFSGRVFIEFFPFFIILYALLMDNVRRKWAIKTLFTLSIVITLFCQIQIYQYRHYQIHWEDTDKELYWKNFMRIDKLL
jgi:hypothetical protein